MGRFGRVGVVIAGYILAIVAAAVAAWLYDVRVGALPYDTSGGMYAGGQMLQSLAVFLMVALAPSLYGLWLLRRHTRFWNGVGVASIAFAAVGHSRDRHMVRIASLGDQLMQPIELRERALERQLHQRLIGLGFVLIIAVGIEVVIGGCAAVHWFVPNSPI